VSGGRLAELDALIDELTIDRYGEEEQFDVAPRDRARERQV
jgi:hypothetical protein